MKNKIINPIGSANIVLLEKNDAFKQIVQAINSKEIDKANGMMHIVARSMKEDKQSKYSSNKVRLINPYELSMFNLHSNGKQMVEIIKNNV